jgi:hypothetical protein
MSIEDTKSGDQPESQSGKENSEGADEKLTLTKSELKELIEGKLKGSGKEISKLQEKLQSYEKSEAKRKEREDNERRAKLAEDGKKDELINLERSEKEALAKAHAEAAERLKAYEERDAARMAKLQERNNARVKELPKELQSIVPGQLDPEALDDYLSKLEKLVVTKTQRVFGSGGVGPRSGSENPFERAKSVGADFLSGKKKKGN